MLRVKVDKSELTDLYEQVAAEIRRAIADGEATPGERLPLAKDLAAVLGVVTNTVLRSLRVLRDEGLLEFRRGRGISVAGTPERRRSGPASAGLGRVRPPPRLPPGRARRDHRGRRLTKQLRRTRRWRRCVTSRSTSTAVRRGRVLRRIARGGAAAMSTDWERFRAAGIAFVVLTILAFIVGGEPDGRRSRRGRRLLLRRRSRPGPRLVPARVRARLLAVVRRQRREQPATTGRGSRRRDRHRCGGGVGSVSSSS